jgi:hypothetical protein
MEEYKYEYAIVLSLAFPSRDAPKNFASIDIFEKVKKAEADYNKRFKGKKEINVINVIGHDINLELSISFIPKNATREISVFSQILIQDFHFDEYSSKQGRLFNSEIVRYPEGIGREYVQIDHILPRGIISRAGEQIMQESYNNYLVEKEYYSNTYANVFLKMSNEILAADDIDKLENYIKQLENLTSLAKSKKDIMLRSKK